MSSSSDPSTISSIAAVVVAAAALIIAAAQVAQQYISSGPLIRLCDSYVYGPMPGGGRRAWSMRQFRFRVLYEIAQVKLPARYWLVEGFLGERAVEEELRLNVLPSLLRVEGGDSVGWMVRAKMAVGMFGGGRRKRVGMGERGGEYGEKDLELNSDTGHEMLLRDEAETRVLPRHSGEACWVSFCRMAQMRSSLYLTYRLLDGDADRCPADLQVVPMMVSLRDIVAICFMFGMRLVWADVSRRLVQMEGEVGTLIATPHPQLSVLVRFVPRDVDRTVEMAYAPFEANIGGWMGRLRGIWMVGEKAMRMGDLTMIARRDDFAPTAEEERGVRRRSRGQRDWFYYQYAPARDLQVDNRRGSGVRLQTDNQEDYYRVQPERKRRFAKDAWRSVYDSDDGPEAGVEKTGGFIEENQYTSRDRADRPASRYPRAQLWEDPYLEVEAPYSRPSRPRSRKQAPEAPDMGHFPLIHAARYRSGSPVESRDLLVARRRLRRANDEVEKVQRRISRLEQDIKDLNDKDAVPPKAADEVSETLSTAHDESNQPPQPTSTELYNDWGFSTNARQVASRMQKLSGEEDQNPRQQHLSDLTPSVQLELRGGGNDSDQGDAAQGSETGSILSDQQRELQHDTDSDDDYLKKHESLSLDADRRSASTREADRQPGLSQRPSKLPARPNAATVNLPPRIKRRPIYIPGPEKGAGAPYWLCQLTILPGFFVSNIRNRQTLPSPTWSSVLLTILKQLLTFPSLQFLTWDSSIFRDLQNALDSGCTTFPVHAVSGSGESAVCEYMQTDVGVFLGFQVEQETKKTDLKLPVIPILAHDLIHPHAPGGSRKRENDMDLCTLMGLDNWLNAAGSTPPISRGPSSLITDTPLFVATLFRLWRSRVDDLVEDQEEGGDVSEDDALDARLVEELAGEMAEDLLTWKLSEAERLYVLVAAYRAAKLGWCLAVGADSSVVESVFGNDSSVYLA